jgi:hypothetical protein
MQPHVIECIAVFELRVQSVQANAAPQGHVCVHQYAVESPTKGVYVEHRGDARGTSDEAPKPMGAHVACIAINVRHLWVAMLAVQRSRRGRPPHMRARLNMTRDMHMDASRA